MKIIGWIVVVIVALFASALIAAAVKGNSPPTPKEHDRYAIEQCWLEQGRKSHSAGEAQFLAGACEHMEAKFETSYGVKP